MSVVGVGLMEVVMVLLLGGGLGIPLGLPPLAEDPALSRVAPEECLFYGNWSGTAAADANSANRTERLLAEDEVQGLVKGVDQIIIHSIRRAGGPQGPLVEELYGLVKTLLTRPTALFVAKITPAAGIPAIDAGLVMNTGDQAAAVQKSLDRLLVSAGLSRSNAAVVTIGETKLAQLALPANAPQVLWGFHANYLIVTVGKASAEQIVAGLTTSRDPPSWLVDVRRRMPVERLATISYLNVDAVKRLAIPFAGPRGERMIEALGLSGVKSMSSVSGLDGEGLVQHAFIEVQGPLKGALAFAQAEPLSPADLKPIPRDATVALAARVDLPALLENFRPFWNELDPELRADLDKQLSADSLGFDVDRLTRSLGDVWCVYSSPSEGGFVVTGLTAVVRVRDRAGVQQAIDGGLALFRKEFPEPVDEEDNVRRWRRPRLNQFEFRGKQVWSVDISAPVTPAWCLTDQELIVSLYPQTIKAYLARPADAPSLAAVPEVAAAFKGPSAPSTVAYQDTKTIFRTLYPMVQGLVPMILGEMRRSGIEFDPSLLPAASTIDQHLGPAISVVRKTEQGTLFETRQVVPFGGTQFSSAAPLAIAALLPAVAAARESAKASVTMNNLKQIALAMHNYHDVYARLPAPANYDKKGQPLLSWRVHVLPFLEQQPLYEEFHLDEPWDSEHNKKLIEKMPAVFKTPAAPSIEAGKTVYLLPRGPGTLFERNRGPSFSEIVDGTSTTAMCVEAALDRAVIWTKPDDLAYDPKEPKSGLGNPRGRFLLVLCDGAVRSILQDISADTLRALFTHRGGEAVGKF